MQDDLETPPSEKLRGYIKSRIPQLKRQKERVQSLSILTFIISIILTFVELISFGNLLIVGVLLVLGRGVWSNLIDVRIDQLHQYWRDLDRDEAYELYGFENPM